MTDTTTPQPDQQPPLEGENLDQAMAAAEATPAPASLAEGEEPSLAALEKMTDEQLDAYLTTGTTEVPATAATTEGAPAGDAKPADSAEKPEGGDDKGAKPGDMIPRARLNQALEKQRLLEEENLKLREDRAYSAGRADALSNGWKPAEAEVDPEVVISQNLNQLHANYEAGIIKLAKEYDDGKLTTEQWRKKEQELGTARDRLKADFERQLGEVREAKSAPDPNELMNFVQQHEGLAQYTADLNAANPWLAGLSPSLNEPLRVQAEKVLAEQGIALSGHPTKQDLVQYTADLRMAIVEVAKTWGLDKAASAPAATSTSTATPPQKATPEQIKSKLDLARMQPPSPTMAGTSLPTDALAGLPTEEMSVDQLASLPAAQLDALAERESKRTKAA